MGRARLPDIFANFRVAMTAEDLAKSGLDTIGKKYGA